METRKKLEVLDEVVGTNTGRVKKPRSERPGERRYQIPASQVRRGLKAIIEDARKVASGSYVQGRTANSLSCQLWFT